MTVSVWSIGPQGIRPGGLVRFDNSGLIILSLFSAKFVWTGCLNQRLLFKSYTGNPPINQSCLLHCLCMYSVKHLLPVSWKHRSAFSWENSGQQIISWWLQSWKDYWERCFWGGSTGELFFYCRCVLYGAIIIRQHSVFWLEAVILKLYCGGLCLF